MKGLGERESSVADRHTVVGGFLDWALARVRNMRKVQCTVHSVYSVYSPVHSAQCAICERSSAQCVKGAQSSAQLHALRPH